MTHSSSENVSSGFDQFSLPAPLMKALQAMKYETPTPVQRQAIPLAMAGKDLLVTAQTGTGKTAAFAIPLLSRILGGTKKPTLIIAPTRELAEQIGDVMRNLTQASPHIKICVLIGGVSYHMQERMLRSKPLFVVGTPGRLIDQVERKNLDLSTHANLVIDEADRLMDMGFIPQVEKLVASLPKQRQTMMFSATMPSAIQKLAERFLHEPERIAIGAPTSPVDRIQQDIVQTSAQNKNDTLIRELDKVSGSIIVFARTKHRTERLAKFLSDAGHKVARIHGDRSQKQRSDALKAFRDGEVRILVATDIAARGIDVSHIEHVVNYDLPMAPEDYIHRIGRTARAGAEGHSIALVTPEETKAWAKIHKLMYGKMPEGLKPQPSKRKSGGKFGAKTGNGKFGGKPVSQSGEKSDFKFGKKDAHKNTQKNAQKNAKSSLSGGKNRNDERSSKGPKSHGGPGQRFGKKSGKPSARR